MSRWRWAPDISLEQCYVVIWGSNCITTLAVPEGRTYDEFREENLNSNKAPMLFAHYTVDFDFYDQLPEIFTK